MLRSDAAPDLRVTVRRSRSGPRSFRRDAARAGCRSRHPAASRDLRPGHGSARWAPTTRRRRARSSQRLATPSLARIRACRRAPNGVLAADALNATNWPGLAVSALRQAEKASPAVATTRGVLRLAAVAAALSGDPLRACKHHDTVADRGRGQHTVRPESARHGERRSRHPTGGPTAANTCAQGLRTQPGWRRSESRRERGGRTPIFGSGGGDSTDAIGLAPIGQGQSRHACRPIDARRSGRPIGRGADTRQPIADSANLARESFDRELADALAEPREADPGRGRGLRRAGSSASCPAPCSPRGTRARPRSSSRKSTRLYGPAFTARCALRPSSWTSRVVAGGRSAGKISSDPPC